MSSMNGRTYGSRPKINNAATPVAQPYPIASFAGIGVSDRFQGQVHNVFDENARPNAAVDRVETDRYGIQPLKSLGGTTTDANSKKKKPKKEGLKEEFEKTILDGNEEDIAFLKSRTEESSKHYLPSFYKLSFLLPSDWNCDRTTRCRLWLESLGFEEKIYGDSFAYIHATKKVDYYRKKN